MTATLGYHRSARACMVRSYIRYHAARCGAPRALEDELAHTAVTELLGGSSAWRAVKHAIEELDRRADAQGWWGINA